MLLADRAKICVRGGDGGNGCVSFRREKFVPKGGPDGGDGGRGGDVVLVASGQVRDLASFHHKVHYTGPRGGHGSGAQRHGADGGLLTVAVPVGTEVRTFDGELLADLATEGASVLVAGGGEGGRGNSRFSSSRRRAPGFAERGLTTQERWLNLTMKLLADVGLVGLPNAGKSSLLAALTRARPRIASYPFTTLEPNLGVLEAGERRLVLADIPGLVEGASTGVGLGHQFLAHIERTAALVYVVDVAQGAEAALNALTTVRAELQAFAPALIDRPGVVALSKIDLADEATVDETTAAVRTAAAGGMTIVPVSSTAGVGLPDLIAAIAVALPQPAPVLAAAAEPRVLRPAYDRASSFTVEHDGDALRVHGATLERLVAKADLDNYEAVAYLQQVMERAGVSDALRRAGAKPGDPVLIGDQEFEFS
jgi:GTP-binding protein